MTVKELLDVADPNLIMDIAIDGEWVALGVDVEDTVDYHGDLIVNRFTVELTPWGTPEATFELYLTKEES